MADRTVHASNAQAEVVRYEKAGHWFIEPRDKALPRQQVTVAEAARYALWLYENNGVIIAGQPGGRAFDRAVQTKGSR